MNRVEEVTKEATAAAMRETMLHITKLPPDQVIPYLVSVLQVAFMLLRDGGKQDEFVRGLIQGAQEELSQPCILTMKDMRVN